MFAQKSPLYLSSTMSMEFQWHFVIHCHSKHINCRWCRCRLVPFLEMVYVMSSVLSESVPKRYSIDNIFKLNLNTMSNGVLLSKNVFIPYISKIHEHALQGWHSDATAIAMPQQWHWFKIYFWWVFVPLFDSDSEVETGNERYREMG